MPGENVNIMISAKPNSYIGLLGVDQRSVLLKSGNDISYVSNINIRIKFRKLLSSDFNEIW